jgi:anti-sigma regulatory factor (Ser/Thr protein kinase)
MTAARLANRLVIANQVTELRRMTEWLWANGTAADIPQDLLFKLDVCANEAVINIITYAYEDSRPHDITLELNKTEAGACLVIQDDGKAFNMLEVAEREKAESLADAAIGGLGIHLIRRLMERCDYQRQGAFNVLSLEG